MGLCGGGACVLGLGVSRVEIGLAYWDWVVVGLAYWDCVVVGLAYWDWVLVGWR